MTGGFARLTGPVTLAGRVAQSRVMFGPHETNLGQGAGRAFSPRHVAYYQRRAAGGAGLIVTETASVHLSDWPYERAPLASAAADGWSQIAAACRPHGTLVLAGLGHTGLQGSSAYSQAVLWGPSGVPDPVTREVPMEMGMPEISSLTAGFAAAAGAAVTAGADGVEIDAGPRALLRQFHSGLTNHRADGYGTDRVETGHRVDAAFLRAGQPDAVILATGAVPVRPGWAHGHPRIVDVRQVADGSVQPEGTVVVVDELGFHPATSVAEFLAGRGCAVEVITSALVAGQDLGLTLDLELWTRTAHMLGARQRTDVVVLDAREDAAGRLELTLLHHPTGAGQRLACDWVACAVPSRPADALWHALRGAVPGVPFEVRRVGDCLAPRRAHAAVIEGERAGAAL